LISIKQSLPSASPDNKVLILNLLEALVILFNNCSISCSDFSSFSALNKEYNSLKKTQNSHIKVTADLEILIKELKEINLKLWNIEDGKRNCEKKKDFGKTFIDLSRNVYLNNDKRAKIKSEINKILGSNINEIKKYPNY